MAEIALFDALARLKLELEIEVLKRQLEGPSPFLVVANTSAAPPDLPPTLAGRIRARIAAAERALERLVPLGARSGKDRFQQLCESLRLSPQEARLLLLGVGPAVDPAFRQLYAGLSETGGGRPSVASAVTLLFGAGERVAAQRLLWESGPLRRFRLLHLSLVAPDQQDLLRQELEATSRVVAHLLGSQGPEGPEARFLRAHWPTVALDQVVLDDSIDPQALVEALRAGPPPVLVLQGDQGTGRKTLAGAAAQALGRGMVVASVAAMPLEPERFEEAVRAAFREAALQSMSLLYFDELETLLDEEGQEDTYRIATLVHVVELYPEVLTALGTTDPLNLRFDGSRPTYNLSLPMPQIRERARLWERFLPPDTEAEVVSAEELAHKFTFSGGAIRRAAQRAGHIARLRHRPETSGPSVQPAMSDFYEACKASSQSSLSSLAERLDRYFRWEDLILRDKTLAQIKELIQYANNRRRVLEEWGFERKLPYGRGVTSLFHGEPGTGKTMVASLIARELNMDLYQIELSRVVSKYIGETEKNLGAIFDEARDAHAILLFDEADSLFARRTDVRSSNDRYSNLEVNYLLQRIESYEGVSILTTNHESSLDDAFKRRLTFVVEFPFPDQKERAGLWKSMFPDPSVLAEDVDLTYLGEDYELSGGHIKKVVLRAAFRAAETTPEGEPLRITMDHLLSGASAVYRELGKLFKDAL